jgi:hypothetical protein
MRSFDAVRILVVLIIFCGTVGVSHEWTPLFWLHIPKCGTSFGLSAALYPRLQYRSPFPNSRKKWRPGDAEHQAIPVSADEEMLRSVVTIFRNPEERRISAYTWKKFHPSCCTGNWGWSKITRQRVSEIAHKDVITGNTNSSYVVDAMGNLTGCQVRMVLGYGCQSEKPAPFLSEDHLQQAISRMRQFRFVGLVDEWRMSICLFNVISTGERFVEGWQLANNRPTAGASSTKYVVPPQMPLDEVDGAFYEAVKKRFWEDVSQYNISSSSCKSLREFEEEENTKEAKERKRHSRVAVVTVGQVRTFRFPSVQRNFLENVVLPLSEGLNRPPDLYFHLSLEFTYPAWRVKSHNERNSKEAHEAVSLFSEISPKMLSVVNDDMLIKRYKSTFPDYRATIFLRWFEVYQNLVSQEQIDRNGTQYQIIVRCRPDAIYTEPLDLASLLLLTVRENATGFAVFDYDFFAIFSRNAAKYGLNMVSACTAGYWACKVRYEMNVQAWLHHQKVKLYSFKKKTVSIMREGSCGGKCEVQCSLRGLNSNFSGCSWLDNEALTLAVELNKDACHGAQYICGAHNKSQESLSTAPFTFGFRKDDGKRISKDTSLQLSFLKWETKCEDFAQLVRFWSQAANDKGESVQNMCKNNATTI